MAIALSPDKRTLILDLQGSLWSMPAAGGAAKRITDEYNDARQPSWSPDARRIAFQSYRDGTWRIATIAADGSGMKALTSGPFDAREPNWSPDGKSIAFSSDRSGNYDVWTLDVATGEVRQVTKDPGNDFFPAWSPDGREIAFVSTRTTSPGVYAITLDGKERFIAPADGQVGAPSWSPNGSQVLFSVVPGNGFTSTGTPRLMLNSRELATGEDYFPFRAQWLSADEFLYPADGRIKRRSIAGGLKPPVDFAATLTVAPASYAKKRRAFDAAAAQPVRGLIHPVVSPDGKQLAFAALGDLWIMPIGGTPKRITDDAFVDADAAWSPDGTRLAFSSDRAGGMDVWIRDLKSGADRRVTTLPGADMAAAWSPDGKSIAFVSNVDFEQGEVFVVAADGGEPRRILDRSFGLGYPSWSADGRFLVTAAFKPYSSRYREGMNYYSIVPAAGGAPRMVVPVEHKPVGKRAADGPALSPDGKQLAFVSNGYLHVMPVNASGDPAGPPRQITKELADSISWAGSNQILYMATDHLKLVSVADGAARDVAVPLTWQRKVPSPSSRMVVHAGRLVDGVQQTARPDVDIIVEGHRIKSIEPHAAALHTGTVVDASGLAVMPGLIEAHGHALKEHGTTFGRVHLAYGITTVRSPGGVPYEALEEREAIESGRRVGPRLYLTGYLLDGWRPYYPMASTAPTEDVVDIEVERARRLDYDLIKTYVRLPDLLQKRAIEGAHRIGIATSSHEIFPAALSGTDSVEHTGATSRRGYSPKQSGTGRSYEDVIQIVAKSRMTLTPTAALGGFQAATAGDPSIMRDPRMTALQPPWVAAAASGGRGGGRGGRGVAPAPDPRALHAFIQRSAKALKDFLDAGVPLVAGVDSPLSPYGVSLHIELEAYVEAGFTPFQALKTATVNTAALLNAQADLGTIEPGKLADMVIVEGNPLTSIRDTAKVKKVIKNGEIFTVEELLHTPRPTSTAAGGGR